MIINKVAWTPVIGRKIPFARTRGQELYYNLGGKIEAGETHTQALMREVLEEASVHIIPGTIRLIRSFEGPAHGQPVGTVLRMWCYDAQHEGKIEPAGEVDQITLFDIGDARRTTVMGKMILGWFQSERYLTSGHKKRGDAHVQRQAQA